jgi:hypothetical protein
MQSSPSFALWSNRSSVDYSERSRSKSPIWPLDPTDYGEPEEKPEPTGWWREAQAMMREDILSHRLTEPQPQPPQSPTESMPEDVLLGLLE